MALSLSSTKKLNNGVDIPIFGLGVWQMKDGPEAENAIAWALDAGYRLIDTATIYGNEASVGKAIRASGIPREEIFVTTKLWPSDFFHAEGAFNESMERLGLEYLDLYLVHWPAPFRAAAIWKTMEKLYESKRVRAIGVSNYSIAHMNGTLEIASIPPAVNQIEFHPFHYDPHLFTFCETENIAVEAYSPLARGQYMDDRTILLMARAYQKTPAQIMIRWALQHDTIVIPKSSNRDRIVENADVFDFEIIPEHMQTLDSLS
jgi:diketogulonate reductase-like aldo/keto reductase